MDMLDKSRRGPVDDYWHDSPTFLNRKDGLVEGSSVGRAWSMSAKLALSGGDVSWRSY